MEKLKDIIYDKSDLLITLVIILMAGLLIWNRVDSIMAYSEVDTKTVNTTQEAEIESATDSAVEPTTGAVVNFTINDGEASSIIAQNLLDEGLISSANEFISAVQGAGAETALRSGTFSIPEGSTPEEIVEILTK